MENLSSQSQRHNPLFEESFSFSSFDYNSSYGIISDDDENDEAYIEITLEQNHEEVVVPQNSTTNNDPIKYDNLEFLRVSISSSVSSFPGFSSSTNYSSSNSSIITETVPSSSSVLCIKDQKNNKRGFKTLNRLVNALFSTLKLKRSSSSSSLLGNTSKSPSKVNVGARKLLIKFRSIKIMSMVVSFVKPKQRQVQASNIGTRGKIKQSKSCPGSVKASPIHQNVSRDQKIYGRDNCVQAAIAHCKQSLARNQIPNCCNAGSGRV